MHRILCQQLDQLVSLEFLLAKKKWLIVNCSKMDGNRLTEYGGDCVCRLVTLNG